MYGAHHFGATENTGTYRELTNCKYNVNEKKEKKKVDRVIPRLIEITN